MVRILVTNDDGIESPGLLKLAQALSDLGSLVVLAPESERSGASASIGPMHLETPQLSRVSLPGIEEAWALSGPPALCVLSAQSGLFGGRFDLVVSGINAGLNPGPSVLHSGTVGAAFTAFETGTTAIAVSQAVSDGRARGSAWAAMLSEQRWDAAATVARWAAEELIEHRHDRLIVNINVPNRDLADIDGSRAVRPRPGHYLSGSAATREVASNGSVTVRFVPREDRTVDRPFDDQSAVDAGMIALTTYGWPASGSDHARRRDAAVSMSSQITRNLMSR
jgi:5'-nucleotidase